MKEPNVIYLKNKKTGVVYAYEDHPYWDPEKKQSRSKRKILGKVDPLTGNVVPTRRRKAIESAEQSWEKPSSIDSSATIGKILVTVQTPTAYFSHQLPRHPCTKKKADTTRGQRQTKIPRNKERRNKRRRLYYTWQYAVSRERSINGITAYQIWKQRTQKEFDFARAAKQSYPNFGTDNPNPQSF